ncbi:hypothetical protein Daus18300_000453 [Diaporthe australafricana]|uniref:Major facilitator superfamily transporter n=1 Tax=Diaporthe australafricana TaxID=127596 RepID=A0ABR3Y4E9_9PEZI
MPPRLLTNRTSAIIAVNTFLFTATVYWVIFFLPVYFQAVQLDSATRAGINVMPVSILGIPTSALAAWAIAKWGKYKIIHLFGFAFFSLGLGLFSRLDAHTPTGVWVGYMFTGPIGGGLLLNSQLPAFQAPASEADQALATGCWNFIRTLGSIWGVAIPAAVFSNHINGLVAAGEVTNPVAAALLVDGGAYEHASAAFIHMFPSSMEQAEIVSVYQSAIRMIFLICIAFSGFSFILCLFEKDVELRTELVTDYGLKSEKEAAAHEIKSQDPEAAMQRRKTKDRSETRSHPTE